MSYLPLVSECVYGMEQILNIHISLIDSLESSNAVRYIYYLLNQIKEI